MGELASADQLRMSFARWALVTVPVVVLLGLASGMFAGSGDGNSWFMTLRKPAAMPPGWAFPIAWTILYVLLGLAIALVLNARGARGRNVAVALFVLELLLNYAWSPLFFAAHQPWPALALIGAMLAVGIAATIRMAGVRQTAGWLMVPYLFWLGFASALNYRIAADNPDAAVLAPGGASAQISG